MKALTALSLGGMLVTATGYLEAADSASDASQADEAINEALNEASQVDAVTRFDEMVARHGDHRLPNHVPVRDATGTFTSVSAHGLIDLDNPFFQDLGGNGQRCVSCHVPAVGWTITPAQLQTTFEETDGGAFDDGLGLGAVFRTNDGANSPTADVSTLAKRRAAYSMLLDRGLIRVGLPIPANAEFELVAVDDPYHYASAAELSLFRRPLPTANLRLISTVLWDGREVVPGASVADELAIQANDAVMGFALAGPISAAQRKQIAQFELALASAQIHDDRAKNLHAAGAQGGPDEILAQEFHIGINDNFGDSVTGAPFTPNVFTIFEGWAHDDHDRDEDAATVEARAAIARGEALFDSKPIAISGVSGINDEAVFGKPAVLMGTCGTCHDTPNGGSHSVVAPVNIGLVDAARRTPDMPLYTLRNKTTGETVQVTDPGRAMIDGKWSHIGRFKGATLRNLAPRAPYFHNGLAKDLGAVVDFYDSRFYIGFTAQEKADLVAFLRSL